MWTAGAALPTARCCTPIFPQEVVQVVMMAALPAANPATIVPPLPNAMFAMAVSRIGSVMSVVVNGKGCAKSIIIQ